MMSRVDVVPWALLFAFGAVIQGAAAVATALRGDTLNALCFAFAGGLMTCALIERVTRGRHAE